MMGIFYPYFLMLLLPLRPVTCFAPPLQAIFSPCGPLMGVLTVMHFSHLLLQNRHFAPSPSPPPPPPAIDGCPPSDAILTSCSSITGKVAPPPPPPPWAVDGCPRSDAVLPPVGSFGDCPSREAAMPPAGLLVSCPLRTQPCPVRGLW